MLPQQSCGPSFESRNGFFQFNLNASQPGWTVPGRSDSGPVSSGDGCSSHPLPQQDRSPSSQPMAISILLAALPALGLRPVPSPVLAAACSSLLPALNAQLAIKHRSWQEIRAELAPSIPVHAWCRWGHRDIPAHGSP